jgi:hypothetical protein
MTKKFFRACLLVVWTAILNTSAPRAQAPVDRQAEAGKFPARPFLRQRPQTVAPVT